MIETLMTRTSGILLEIKLKKVFVLCFVFKKQKQKKKEIDLLFFRSENIPSLVSWIASAWFSCSNFDGSRNVSIKFNAHESLELNSIHCIEHDRQLMLDGARNVSVKFKALRTNFKPQNQYHLAFKQLG